MNIEIGQIIAGKYELVGRLGKGAMGEVWRARHATLGGDFAIKLVEPVDDAEADTAAGRFQLEAQIAAKLSRRTRHIVSVSDHGEEPGLAYLVMELLEGESLEQRLGRGTTLPPAEVAALVLQVSRALTAAHEEGIFHRDLKPANVWLGRDEDGRLLVKLLDFGIARSTRPVQTRSPFATSKDMVLGTPSYMSPEQARGLESLDHRCDVWALAVVAYEALTLRIPFDGQTIEDIFLAICTFRVVPITSLRPDLPPAFAAFFARAFATDIDERFPRAGELAEAFAAIAGGAPLPFAPPSRPSFGDLGAEDDPSALVPAGLAPPRRAVGWGLAAIALLLLAGGGALLVSRLGARPARPITDGFTRPPPSVVPPAPLAEPAAPPSSPAPIAPPASLRPSPPPSVRRPAAPTASPANVPHPAPSGPTPAPAPSPTVDKSELL